MSNKTWARRRAAGIVTLVAAMGLSIIPGFGGTALADTNSGKISDVITFTGHAMLTPPLSGTSRFVLVSDSCTITSAGESPMPCRFVGVGTVTATGGVARGIITSRDGVISLDETFVFTGPTTSVGTGSATEISSAGAPTTGTFVANITATPTDNPNVLSESGIITVRDAP